MSKFKQGDKVIVKETGQIGTIKNVHPFTIAEVEKIYGHCPTGYHYDVEFEDGSIDTFLEDKLAYPTTDFLTELQNLLRRYDAKINVIPFQPITLQFLSDEFAIHYNKNLTPDNIFDYEHFD